MLLRNSEGQAWTKDAVNCAFCRLKEKLGVKYYLGAFRKGVSPTSQKLRPGFASASLRASSAAAKGRLRCPGFPFSCDKVARASAGRSSDPCEKAGGRRYTRPPSSSRTAASCVFLDESTASRKDAAERDLGPALVAKRIIHDQRDHPPGIKWPEIKVTRTDAQVIPLSRSGMADGVGGIMTAFGCQTSGLSDLADSVGTETDDPTRDQNLEGVEDFDSEATYGRVLPTRRGSG